MALEFCWYFVCVCVWNGLLFLLELWLQQYIASELFVSNPIFLISLVIFSFKNGKNTYFIEEMWYYTLHCQQR